jgi:DNA invertase Pin-like site-specific DNA recombinase
MTRAAIYARVSTNGQDTENQISQLREVAERRGWGIVQVYTDHGISGAKGRDQRPQFDALIKDATKIRRPFDVIMCWSVDRLGRSLTDLVAFLAEIQGGGANLYMHQQQVDTTTPAGKAMFQMLGVFAEFERSLIVSRVNAGLDRARAKGVRLGRKPIAPIVIRQVQTSLMEGMSYRKIAAKHNVSLGKVAEIAKNENRNS